MRFIEKITNDWNMELAISKVKSNKGAPGVDHMTVDEIDEYFKGNGRKIRTEIRQMKYPKTANGIEVLVHMGIDIVSLDGKGFELFVKKGDKVTTDSKIAEMNLNLIKESGKSNVIIVLITNMDQVATISPVSKVEGQHIAGALLGHVSLK